MSEIRVGYVCTIVNFPVNFIICQRISWNVTCTTIFLLWMLINFILLFNCAFLCISVAAIAPYLLYFVASVFQNRIEIFTIDVWRLSEEIGEIGQAPAYHQILNIWTKERHQPQDVVITRLKNWIKNQTYLDSTSVNRMEEVVKEEKVDPGK